MPKILHVDINSYFATILQQENPGLRGKPVGVLKETGRTVIIAASKEAKLYGVKTGSMVRDARELCPQIILVPAQFDFYLSATQKLKAVFEGITPKVFMFSLDEAFLDVTGDSFRYPDPFRLGSDIQNKIKESLGEWVTCNVGISYNRLLAKLASEVSPKGSITEITTKNRDEYLKNAEFADICGIGFALSAKLENLGISNPFDIRTLSDQTLLNVFGPFWSQELRTISLGEDSFILREEAMPAGRKGKGFFKPHEHMKSVSRSVTGHRLCDSEMQIRSILYNLCEEVAFKTRRMGLSSRQIGAFLEGEDKSWRDHVTLKHSIDGTQEIFEVVYQMLYTRFKRNFRVIRFGVRISLLTPSLNQTLPLFEARRKNDKLYKALDKLSLKYGLFTVHSGVLTKHEVLMPEVTGYFGDREYYLNNLVQSTV